MLIKRPIELKVTSLSIKVHTSLALLCKQIAGKKATVRLLSYKLRVFFQNSFLILSPLYDAPNSAVESTFVTCNASNLPENF